MSVSYIFPTHKDIADTLVLTLTHILLEEDLDPEDRLKAIHMLVMGADVQLQELNPEYIARQEENIDRSIDELIAAHGFDRAPTKPVKNP